MWQIIQSSFSSGCVKPKDFVVTEFDDRSLIAFRNRVFEAFELGQEIFPVQIESNGGNGDILMGFCSVVEDFKERGMKFVTFTVSRAMSCGAFLFCLGDQRFMGKKAVLMFHPMSLFVEDRISQVKNYTDFSLEGQKELFVSISKNLKKNGSWLENLLKKGQNDDLYFSAEEAKSAGIINDVKIPVFSLEMVNKFSYN